MCWRENWRRYKDRKFCSTDWGNCKHGWHKFISSSGSNFFLFSISFFGGNCLSLVGVFFYFICYLYFTFKFELENCILVLLFSCYSWGNRSSLEPLGYRNVNITRSCSNLFLFSVSFLSSNSLGIFRVFFYFISYLYFTFKLEFEYRFLRLGFVGLNSTSHRSSFDSLSQRQVNVTCSCCYLFLLGLFFLGSDLFGHFGIGGSFFKFWLHTFYLQFKYYFICLFIFIWYLTGNGTSA